MDGYDIIGDIHAQGSRLEALLRRLGYEGAYFEHPEGRKAIYIGDLIDRGTEHAKTFDIVRRQNAKVLMGNHEFNALCLAKEGVRGHIRPHTPQNLADQADFFREFPPGSDAYKEAIAWFETFPVYHEEKSLRLIHACWNDAAIGVCKPFLKRDRTLREKAYGAYDTENPADFWKALEILIKGPEHKLPRAVHYEDGQGNARKNARLYWWADKNISKEQFLHHGQDVIRFFSSNDLKNLSKLKNKFNYASQIPVIFGHYNLLQDVHMVSPNAACINFRDRIVAYRWNKGDKALSADRLEFV